MKQKRDRQRMLERGEISEDEPTYYAQGRGRQGGGGGGRQGQLQPQRRGRPRKQESEEEEEESEEDEEYEEKFAKKPRGQITASEMVKS
jgi:hypothetical protein